MPVLRTMADQAAEGCLVKPIFYQWVMDDGLDITINLMVPKPRWREPDGRFHASSHPLASKRELWLWLAGRTVPEPFGYTSRMAVMFGSLGHGVVETFLDWMGAAVPLPEGNCPACGRPRRPLRARPSLKYCTEHGAVHPDTRSSCHLDSILRFGGDLHGFDLKTIYPLGLRGVPDMNESYFREKWPKYWAQMQECMRITGLRRYIVFFLSMGSPWEVREFHIPFDPAFAVETEAKYRAVIEAFERGQEILL